MIRLNNVTKKFGSNEVLKGIDLTVKTGEKLVIIGPSGSGKSTLIRLMNGLEETSSGTVEIDGKQMTRQSRAKLNREYSSMVFQQFNLYPHKTVLENLTLAPIKLKGMRSIHSLRRSAAANCHRSRHDHAEPHHLLRRADLGP